MSRHPPPMQALVGVALASLPFLSWGDGGEQHREALVEAGLVHDEDIGDELCDCDMKCSGSASWCCHLAVTQPGRPLVERLEEWRGFRDDVNDEPDQPNSSFQLCKVN